MAPVYEVPSSGSESHDGFPVIKSDATVFARLPRALYVGGTGDVKLRTIRGTDLTFVGVPAGGYVMMSCDMVYSTGTTASSIVALY